MTDQNETPEDIVRRLIASDVSYGPPIQSAPNTNAKPPKKAGNSKQVQSLFGRLTELPRRRLHDIYARAHRAVLSYRPTARHMAVLLLIAISLTMPWLIPVLILLGLLLLLISYLTLGSDRSTELTEAWFGRFSHSNPAGAEALRGWAERVSTRLTGLVEWLPERWTTGLYLPDFSRPEELSTPLSEDPFDRLTGDTTNQ